MMDGKRYGWEEGGLDGLALFSFAEASGIGTAL